MEYGAVWGLAAAAVWGYQLLQEAISRYAKRKRRQLGATASAWGYRLSLGLPPWGYRLSLGLPPLALPSVQARAQVDLEVKLGGGPGQGAVRLGRRMLCVADLPALEMPAATGTGRPGSVRVTSEAPSESRERICPSHERGSVRVTREDLSESHKRSNKLELPSCPTTHEGCSCKQLTSCSRSHELRRSRDARATVRGALLP
jgi:hypothetical protein